jgi:hypothetical protein
VPDETPSFGPLNPARALNGVWVIPRVIGDRDWANMAGTASCVPEWFSSELTLSLGGVWAELAELSLQAGEVRTTWVSRSTLLGAAAANLADSLHQVTHRTAAIRGATSPAPIHAATDAPGTFWTNYRDWFPLHTLVDERSLALECVYNLSTAARAAVTIAKPETEVDYDEGRRELILTRSSIEVGIDLESVVFLGVMGGFIPEQAAALAVIEAEETLDRLIVFAERAEAALGVCDVSFQNGAPIILVNGRTIVDGYAADRYDSGGDADEHVKQLVEAASSADLFPCTCTQERLMQPALRKREDVYSFTRRNQEPVSAVAVGEAHCLTFRLVCAHVEEPIDVPGADADEITKLLGVWAPDAFRRGIAAASASALLQRAALLHGNEVSAAVASPAVLSGLAQRVGFQPGSLVTVYAPFSNLLFLTDESARDVQAIAETLIHGPLKEAVQITAIQPGAQLNYLAEMTLIPAPPSDVPIEPIPLRSSLVR